MYEVDGEQYLAVHAGNTNTRGATQFFEGLFDIRLAPGESYPHTFDTRGEYFFSDPHGPRSTADAIVNVAANSSIPK